MSFRQTDFPEGAAYFGSNRGWCYTETTAGAVGSRTWKTIQFNVDFRHKLTQIWCKCRPKSNISFEIHSQCIFFKCSEIFLELFADFLFIQQDLLKVLCEPTVCFLYNLIMMILVEIWSILVDISLKIINFEMIFVILAYSFMSCSWTDNSLRGSRSCTCVANVCWYSKRGRT